MSDEPERKLYGAAATAAAKKAAGGSLEAFMEQLASSLDERLEQARQAVAEREEELEKAKRAVRMLEAIMRVQSGEVEAKPEPRRKAATAAPRASRADGQALRDKIKEILSADKDGKPVAEIIKLTDADPQRVRNQLSLLVKNGDLGKSGKLYSLP